MLWHSPSSPAPSSLTRASLHSIADQYELEDRPVTLVECMTAHLTERRAQLAESCPLNWGPASWRVTRRSPGGQSPRLRNAAAPRSAFLRGRCCRPRSNALRTTLGPARACNEAQADRDRERFGSACATSWRSLSQASGSEAIARTTAPATWPAPHCGVPAPTESGRAAAWIAARRSPENSDSAPKERHGGWTLIPGAGSEGIQSRSGPVGFSALFCGAVRASPVPLPPSTTCLCASHRTRPRRSPSDGPLARIVDAGTVCCPASRCNTIR